MENCVLVTNNSASIDDLRKFISDNLEKIIPRGNHSFSKMMILSGCHGTVDGSDGVNSLGCLSNSSSTTMHETRKFYEDMCSLFGLEPEGEDPRVYDVKCQNIVGVKTGIEFVWKERAPTFLFGSWMERLGIETVDEAKLVIKIIDVAAYHENVYGLMEEIKNYEPTILTLDWCHNLDGFTANHLKANGILSNIILRNEEFLQTKKMWIRLSDEQHNVLEEARTIELKGGEAFFLHGEFGSGKTVLGIEIARILSSRRKLEEPGKKIQIIFTAPEDNSEFLLNYHRNTSFTLEKKDTVRVIGIEKLFQEEQLGDDVYPNSNPVSTVQTLTEGLRARESHFIVIIDEMGRGNQNWSQFQLVNGVDIIVLPKQDYIGAKQMILPSAETGVRVHHLAKSYRQSLECLRSHQYILSHGWLADSITNFENFEGNRLPIGEATLWIEVTDENITDKDAFEKVKEELAEEKNVLVRTLNKEIVNNCKEMGWIGGNSLYGFEADVSKRVHMYLVVSLIHR